MLDLPQYVGHIPLNDVFGFGHAGVDFFFVLSGFIIYYVHHDQVGGPDHLGSYVWKRATRIYPIYWVIMLTVIALNLVAGDAGEMPFGYVAGSLALVPQGRMPLLGVSWTLNHEVLFYALFAVAIVSRRIGFAVLVAWMVMTALRITLPDDHDWVVGFLLSPSHLEFVLGIGAAHLVLRGGVRSPVAVAVTGAAAFLLLGALEDAGIVPAYGVEGRVLYGAASAILVLGLASAEQRRLIRIGPVPSFIGDASYSIYLVHTIIIGLVAHALASAGVIRFIPGWIAMLIVVSSAVAVASAVHLWIERPLSAALRRRALFAPLPVTPPVA